MKNIVEKEEEEKTSVFKDYIQGMLILLLPIILGFLIYKML
jgi:hypothetical protein